MSMTVGELNVLLKADPSTIINNFNTAESAGNKAADNLNKKWEDASKKFQAVGTKMSTFVSLPIAALGVASVKLASDLAETTNKVDVAFGDSAKAVEDWSKTSIDKMGMAAQTAMDSAALYGDMATGMGLATDEASTMAMGLTQLAGDLASFKNIQVDVAKTALAGVFTGETESLKQLGIIMTETNLKQYAMSQGITKNIADMTQAEKINLRYAYVLSVTGNAQGDFARTSDGVANQTRTAAERVKELGASMGTLLLPAVGDMLSGVNNLLKGFMNLTDGQKKTILTVAGLVAAIGPAIKIFGTMQTAVKGVQGVIKAFSAEGLIGQTIAAAVASKAQAAAATEAAVATTAEGAAATGTGVQMSMFAVSSTGAAVSTAGVGVASTAATPAVIGFGAALKAALGPIALVIAGGVALFAVFSHFDKASEDMQRVAESSDALTTSVKENIAAYEDSSAKFEAQGTLTDELITKLGALSEASTGATWEQSEMTGIVSQLNTMYPTLSLAIDENTGKLNLNEKELRDQTTALRALTKEQANQEAYNQLMEDKNTLMVDQIALQAKINPGLTEQQKELVVLASKMTGAVSTIKLFNKETGQMIADQAVAIKAFNEGEITAAQLDQTLSNLAGTTREETTATADATTALTANVDALKAKLDAGQTLTEAELSNIEILTASGATFNETELAQIDEQTKAYEDAKEEYVRIMDERVSAATNAFEKIDKGEDLSYQNLVDNLNSNATAMSEWTTNMNTLAGSGLDKGFLATLEAKGTDAAQIVQNMVDHMRETGDESWIELNEAFARSTTTGINAVDGLMTSSDATGIASEFITANARGAQANLELKAAASNQVVDTKIAMKGAIVASDFPRLGADIIDGLTTGLNNAKETLLSAARGIASQLKTALTIRGTISATTSGRTASIDVGWYAAGAAFYSPQVIGVGDTEGGEVVMPINTLFDKLGGMVSEIMNQKPSGVSQTRIVNIYPQTMTDAQWKRGMNIMNEGWGFEN